MTLPNLHAACAAFPYMNDDEIEKLAVDIDDNGQRDPCIMLDGELLDGKNRWRACEHADRTPVTREFGSDPTDGDDPIKFVMSKNVRRRDLTKPQRAFIAEELANLSLGSNQFKKEGISIEISSPTKIEDAAKAMGVSRAMVGAARAVKQHGADNVINMAKRGEVGLRSAESIVTKVPKADQEKMTAEDIKHANWQGRQERAEQPKRGPGRPRTRPPAEPKINRLFARPVRALRTLSLEETGRPVGAAAREQDPDSPPGVTRAIAHITKHGMVQARSLDDVRQSQRNQRFMKIQAALNECTKILDGVDCGPDLAAEFAAFTDTRFKTNYIKHWTTAVTKIDAAVGNIKDALKETVLMEQNHYDTTK
jgi:hypothetical protein